MKLQPLIDLVQRLKPGEHVVIDPREFDFRTDLFGEFSPADWVLENIVGSAYEFRYYEHFPTRHVVFERLPKPLDGTLYSYVSPDRRDFFRQRPDGLYERNGSFRLQADG